MKRLSDDVLAWLMRPRVRRVRRWAFLVTVPVALYVICKTSPESTQTEK